jgi:outer membrane protein assembly factor BamA
MKFFYIILFLLLYYSTNAQRNYIVQYSVLDQPASSLPKLQTNFANQNQATNYINKLLPFLRNKGFISSSIDSVQYQKDKAKVILYCGKQYFLANVNIKNIPFETLIQCGWDLNAQRGIYNFEKLYVVQNKLLNFYQEAGYPFSKISLQTEKFLIDSVHMLLAVDTGIKYRIDSVRNLGKAKIKRTFLQQYLGIKSNSVYKKSLLDAIPNRINQLPYVSEQYPYSLTMLGSSAIVNLYLQPKKSSIINVLLGVVPVPNPNGLANVQRSKVFLSGDANILLNNSLSIGETIALNYQQLTLNSRRINVRYKQPYILKSNYGLETQFELYKRDSSFINIDMNLGVLYNVDQNKYGKVFIQQVTTSAFPDTNQLKLTKRLPAALDVRLVNIGVQYNYNKTNFLRTPTKGLLFNTTFGFGRKVISKNNAIVNLKSGGFNYAKLYDSVKLNTYQLKVNVNTEKYIPFGKQYVLKLAVQSGLIYSQNYLRNELFQIGGFKTLRGFDEESQFCNQYIVPTIEGRLLLGNDSYFFAFVDGGYTKNNVAKAITHTYISTGLGMSFATKTGLFNLSVAAGGRDDIRFGFKQSKLHFGYVSFF